MKVVLLTKKCRYADMVLKGLSQNNIKIGAIVIEKLSAGGIAAKARRFLKSYGFVELGKIAINKLRNNVNRKKNDWLNDEHYSAFTENIKIVDNFNGPASEQLLKGLQPDIIILAGTRILKPNIIQIPSAGIINAHPGLLPKYRGVDVIPWAILNGDIPGVTLHFVDKGVDTGRIIAKKELGILKTDTINELRLRAEILSANMILEFLKKFACDNKLTTEENPTRSGKQYYKMDSKTLKKAEKELKEAIHEKYS